MSELWQQNIRRCLSLVTQNDGSSLVAVVSGSILDTQYWHRHVQMTKKDVFRNDGTTLVVPVAELRPKGNFLGTLLAWNATKAAVEHNNVEVSWPGVSLISMVFGKGRRLSPFTQSLGDRKSAFPTPRVSSMSNTNLRTADLSHLCTAILTQYLEQCGFRGALIKWGDEALVPGLLLQNTTLDLSQVDAVRFVSVQEISPLLAREKDWILFDRQNGSMQRLLTRQDIHHLRERANFYNPKAALGVNLGSLAVSAGFLDIAAQTMKSDLEDVTHRVDWDPYVWLALFCADDEQWQNEMEHEASIGRNGLIELQAHYPDFYQKMRQLRSAIERHTGRPLRVATIDFGEPLWIDYGLHVSLRESLQSLIGDNSVSKATRLLFDIPEMRDRNGNILVRSSVPAGADIRDSVIIDTVILDDSSIVHGAVIVGGRHHKLLMPKGGAALFCAADSMNYVGPNAIALRSVGNQFVLAEGARQTCLFTPETVIPLASNEDIVDYNSANYTQPILGNTLSFMDAGQIMSRFNGHEIESNWFKYWNSWLDC